MALQRSDLRTIRLLCLAATFLVAGAAWAQVASADAAEPMYDPSTVYAVDLDLPQASFVELEEHPTDDWDALGDVTSAVATFDPEPLVENIASLLASWQAEEEANSTRGEHTAEEVEEGVGVTLDFIAGRQAEAEEWLAENKPPSIIPAGPPADDQAQPPKTGPVALFAHAGRSGRYLTTRLQMSIAGTIALRASMKTPKGRKRVCAAGKTAAAAAEWPVSCKLSELR